MNIPFEQIADAALVQARSLVSEWFPAGKFHGPEYRIGGIGGEPGESFAINVQNGKWGEFNGLGKKGGDLIGLYAEKFHAGDRIASAKELGRKLGIYVNGESAPQSALAVTGAIKETQKEQWDSFAPPEDAPSPDLAGWDVTYTYRDAAGRAVRYVCRKNAVGKKRKVFVPLTWGILNGVTGWHRKHPKAPRSLYGLDRLAAMPDAVVLAVEGEKACEAAQSLFPNHPCITWTSGTENVSANDWSPLAGRRVIYWPDNDGPGHKAAVVLRAILGPIAKQIETLRVDDLPDSADAADVSPADPVAWLRERLAPAEAPQETEYPAYSTEDAAPDSADEGVIPLGHDRGVFYYYSRSARQVFPIPAAGHSKNALAALASVAHYWQRTRHVSDKGAVLWDDAIDWLMRECRAVGIYDPDRIRGRGAWVDEGRAVLHVGDRLIVDGRPSGLILEGSRYIYEAAKPLATAHAEPLSTADAHRLVEICKALSWQHGISGLLLAGFIVVAPVCGGLSWRPSIWITGGAGSGKSYLKDNILAPAMGGMALLVQSKTTEAGIRQTLNCDARPVLFDEAEREDASAAIRMQGVLDLLRQSSSEGGAEIVKGSQSQTGAKRYRIRSCFALSSINVGIEHQADESRITVLALRDRDPRYAADAERQFAELNRTVQDTVTPAFAAGLLSRSVRLLPVIRANAETFARAVSVAFGSRRAGDQLGALLAGAYALHSDRPITDEAAAEWVRKQDWGAAIRGEVERDELRLLSHLTQSRVRFSPGNGPPQELTVSRLILGASGHDTLISLDAADAELRQIGVRYDVRGGAAGIFVSTNHPQLKRIMGGTPWSAGWARALGRLPGAILGEQKSIRFAFGHVSKAVWVPLSAIDDGEPDDAV